jgi:hypothetical protein
MVSVYNRNLAKAFTFYPYLKQAALRFISIRHFLHSFFPKVLWVSFICFSLTKIISVGVCS